jgi:hypothetical protein
VLYLLADGSVTVGPEGVPGSSRGAGGPLTRPSRHLRGHARADRTARAPGTRQGDTNRDGEILEVRGDDGRPPYLVRWSDTGHEGLFFPEAGAVVRPAGPDPA